MRFALRYLTGYAMFRAAPVVAFFVLFIGFAILALPLLGVAASLFHFGGY